MKFKKSTKKLIMAIVMVLAFFVFIKLFFVGFRENFRAYAQETGNSPIILWQTHNEPVRDSFNGNVVKKTGFSTAESSGGAGKVSERDDYGFNNFVNYYANWNYSPYFTPLPTKEISYMKYYSDLPMITDRWLVG